MLVHAWLLATCMLGQTTDRLPERFEFTQIQMGMPFRIVLYAPDEDSANAAARAAFAKIKHLNGIMSDYEPESELMLLCRTAGTGMPVKVSRDLLTVLSRSLELSKKSDGAFDVTVGPVVKLWRRARKTRTYPDAEELAAALDLVGFRNIRIDEPAGTVELLKKGMQIDLGGIAVGYAIDEVLALLKERGIASALIDGSGDIGVSDRPPGKEGWRIGIAPLEADDEPSRYIVLKNAAVTTSGDAFQFVELAGKRYSHIVDPRTGVGLVDRSSVTVIARNCTIADSYTKAVSVLGPARGFALIEEVPGGAALVVRAADGRRETFESKRLRNYLVDSIQEKADD
ncbi:MAG TPA: FAD:protein FMN transferase [Planctomycetaceae bacterium]|nr:FAD:protein FMN transferase [Planctomycetaceae bacterium]